MRKFQTAIGPAKIEISAKGGADPPDTAKASNSIPSLLRVRRPRNPPPIGVTNAPAAVLTRVLGPIPKPPRAPVHKLESQIHGARARALKPFNEMNSSAHFDVSTRPGARSRLSGTPKSLTVSQEIPGRLYSSFDSNPEGLSTTIMDPPRSDCGKGNETV